MKKLFLIAAITFQFYSCNTAKTIPSNVTISGHIENNQQYIGGARPPEELLEKLAIYYPSSEQLFYVRNSNNELITSFKTDSNGNYSLQLPNGTYGVFRQEKQEYKQSKTSKPKCDWVNIPDFTLTITEKQSDYSNQYTIDRNFCLEPIP